MSNLRGEHNTVLRDQAQARVKAQVTHQYVRIRRDHALEIARQEAAKSKNKPAGIVIYAPPPLPEPEPEGQGGRYHERSDDGSGDEGAESDVVAQDKNSGEEDGSADTIEDDKTSEPSPKVQKSQVQQRKKVLESFDSPVQSHDSSARLAKAKNSYLSKAAQKSQRREHALFLRRQEYDLEQKNRQDALARRSYMRKLWQKAARPGADGKRRLGRQAPVLLEKARRLMG